MITRWIVFVIEIVDKNIRSLNLATDYKGDCLDNAVAESFF